MSSDDHRLANDPAVLETIRIHSLLVQASSEG